MSDLGEDGCQCGSISRPPCWFCTNHIPSCQWPDEDCECYPLTKTYRNVVPAAPRLVPMFQRPDLRELDAELNALYDQPA